MPTPREAFTNSVRADPIGGERLRAANYGAAGEMIGQAVQGFGQDLNRVAKDVEEIEIRDAEVAAQEADNIRVAKRLKVLYGDPDNGEPGYFNTEGRNAVTAQQGLTAKLRQVDEEAAAVLKGKPRALRMFEQVTLKRDQDDMPRVAEHAAKQREVWEKQVDSDAFDLAIDNAASSLDPVIVEQNIATAGNLAVKQVLRTGNYDPNSIAQARQAGVGKAVAAVAERMSLKTPMEAQQFVVVNAERMDPDDVGKLLRALEAPAAKEFASQSQVVDRYTVLTSTQQQAVASPTADPLAPKPAGKPQPTAVASFDALHAALLGVETPGGRHTNPDGSLITSRAGAKGAGQIMDASGRDPGYGVKPLQNNSRQEHIRFSRDLLKKYTEVFGGNTVLGLIAYNWGPGNLKNHIKKVGDPSKGQISDAAFINSIPVKEAREYAPKILNRIGVQPGRSDGSLEANPAAQSPTYQGEEINLAASFAKIDADPELTFIQREAIKGEIRERYSLGKTARADAEARLKDAAWTEINRFGDNFTSYEQLPLTIRQQLASNPTLEAQFRNQADGNRKAQQAAADAAAAEAQKRREEAAVLNALELAAANPQEFLKRDWRTMPNLPFEARKSLMGKAEEIRKFNANPADEKVADHDAARTEINRFAGAGGLANSVGVTDVRSVKDPKDKVLLGHAYETLIRWEQNYISKHNKRPSPAERSAQARAIMMPVKITTANPWAVDTTDVVPRFAAPGVISDLKSKGRFGGATVDRWNTIKAELTRQNRGRIPSDEEVRAVYERFQQQGQ